MSFLAVCVGCVMAYALGGTVLKEWALELQRRNPVFQALDIVLEAKGLTVCMHFILGQLLVNTKKLKSIRQATSLCVLVHAGEPSLALGHA